MLDFVFYYRGLLSGGGVFVFFSPFVFVLLEADLPVVAVLIHLSPFSTDIKLIELYFRFGVYLQKRLILEFIIEPN